MVESRVLKDLGPSVVLEGLRQQMLFLFLWKMEIDVKP